MAYEQYLVYGKYFLYFIGFMCILGVIYGYTLVKKSVGWDFIRTFAMVKMSKSLIAIRIKHRSGLEEYTYEPIQENITYMWGMRGKKFQSSVLYDQKGVDFMNGIPILTCTPNDIRPLHRETGLHIKINPAIIMKLITDAYKSAEGEKSKNDLVKMVLWGCAGLALLIIVASSYFTDQISACYQQFGKQATVVAGSVFSGVFQKFKKEK